MKLLLVKMLCALVLSSCASFSGNNPADLNGDGQISQTERSQLVRKSSTAAGTQDAEWRRLRHFGRMIAGVREVAGSVGIR